ncbi:MAG TPA: HAD family hydrolase [Turneriella sp.]|nr:HAD family hydrolase [Turneriella sp.]
MKKTERVYLFDIDGTLVNTSGRSAAAFRKALSAVLNFDPQWRGPELAGQTDASLYARALADTQREDNTTMRTAFFQSYHSHLEENLQTNPPHILTGVHEILSHLKEINATLALLTGNTERGSQLKLNDLFSYFEFGFYGEEHIDRNDLGHAARKRIDAQYGKNFPVTIVGDTPKDIACARAMGADVIAVATGPFSVDELLHADRVLPDLSHWFSANINII